MLRWKLAGSTALALTLATTAAQAQMTPEQVWEDWQALAASTGQSVTTTSVARDGDTLVVEGLTYAADDGAGFKATIAIAEVNFTDLGDGTVEITMSNSYPVALTFPPEEGKTGATDVRLTVSQPGISLIASGTPDETAYDYEAPTLNVKLDGVDGVDAGAIDLVADVTLTGIEGGYSVARADGLTSIASSLDAASTSMVFAFKDPETQGDLRMTASVANLTAESTGSFLPIAQMENLAEALKAGFSSDARMSYGQTSFDIDVTEAGKPTRITGAATGGDLELALGADGLTYGTGMTGATFSASGADIPFPKLDVSYAEGAFRMTMPVMKSDTPQDFSFVSRLVDLVLPPEVWAMADPTGAFPRDPATLIVDTKGTANWAFDIFDPAQEAAMANAVPGQIHSLDIVDLQARAVGAEVTGKGALTFDNTDTVTWDGVPTPTGTVDLTIKGANSVIDKLVAMGLIPADQAMGTRMMIAMFAKAGAGEDELTSQLEFKDKGFFANGQRLR